MLSEVPFLVRWPWWGDLLWLGCKGKSLALFPAAAHLPIPAPQGSGLFTQSQLVVRTGLSSNATGIGILRFSPARILTQERPSSDVPIQDIRNIRNIRQ